MEEKKMGTVALTSLVTGNMIASGIWLLPSAMARLGSLSLLSWVFTALGAMLLAFVFSRMATFLPKTGGPYAYAQRGFGNVLGFQTAFCYWTSVWVGQAAIALAATSYLSVFFPKLADPFTACLVSLAFIWLFTWVNLCGIRVAGIVQIVTTIAKLIPIAFLILFGWFFIHPEYLTQSLNVAQPATSGFGIVSQGAALTLWAFLGVECATVPAGSVKNPEKTIPIATILGMTIVAICYIAASIVIFAMLPNEVLQKSISPFADAAQIVLGDWGKWLIAIGATVSCLGALNGWTLIQGQIPMAAADDNLFLKIFGHRNKRNVPSYGLVITSTLVSILLLLTISPDLVEQYKLIILIATLTCLVAYLYTPVVEIILLKTGQLQGSRKSMLVASLAILYSLWAIYGTGTDVLAYGALCLLASIPLYVFVVKRKS
jgi:APA family basic amino acid/polyamine antiporter